MDLGKPGDVDTTDAIGAAKKRGQAEVVTLLERFKGDAAKTRSEVRKELGINGQYYSHYSFLFLFSSFFHSQFMVFSFFYTPFFTFNLIAKDIEVLSLLSLSLNIRFPCVHPH